MASYHSCFVCYYRYTGTYICHGKCFVKSFYFALISYAISLLNIFARGYLFSSSQIDTSKIYVFPFCEYVLIFTNLNSSTCELCRWLSYSDLQINSWMLWIIVIVRSAIMFVHDPYLTIKFTASFIPNIFKRWFRYA